MYTPPSMVVNEESEAREMVDAHATGWLVTAIDGEPSATLMPLMWRAGHVVAHMARANPHWRDITDGAPALIIVGGPQAYVSPNWYASKHEHGRVVPTWNYLAVHLHGTVHVHHDREWLREVVTSLTDRHERDQEKPWAVTDAPAAFVDTQLGAIVGVEMTVDRYVAKAKLSQNRSAEDQEGVRAGLRANDARSAHEVAVAMELLRGR